MAKTDSSGITKGALPSPGAHMKISALGGSFDFFHNSGRNLLTMALIALAAYECANLIVEDNLLTLYRVALVVLGLAALVAILKDWRKGVYCFVAWIAVEDLIRKYLGNNMIVYFAKDFFALALYLSFFIARRSTLTKLYRPPFLITLLLFFFYAPLVLVGHALVDSQKELRRFFFFNSVLILVVAAFGIAQSILGHTFLNPEVIQEDIRSLSTLYRASPITGLVAYRPTSFFVSAGRFQNFLLVSW